MFKKYVIYVQKNEIDSYETIWGTLGKVSKWLIFDVSKVTQQPWLKRPTATSLLKFELNIETSTVYHSRKNYSFIDLLGDIGGI